MCRISSNSGWQPAGQGMGREETKPPVGAENTDVHRDTAFSQSVLVSSHPPKDYLLCNNKLNFTMNLSDLQMKISKL